MIRPLEATDYDKGFMELINYFTKFPKTISKMDFLKQFYKIKSSSTEVFVFEKDNQIIATGAIHEEYKFHNNFKGIIHLQDVVVKEEYRGHGYGKQMIHFLIEASKTKNCYKIVLNSKPENILFYQKLGFIVKGSELNLYLN